MEQKPFCRHSKLKVNEHLLKFRKQNRKIIDGSAYDSLKTRIVYFRKKNCFFSYIEKEPQFVY